MNTAAVTTHPGELDELLKFAFEEELCHRVADIAYDEEMRKLALSQDEIAQRSAGASQKGNAARAAAGGLVIPATYGDGPRSSTVIPEAPAEQAAPRARATGRSRQVYSNNSDRRVYGNNSQPAQPAAPARNSGNPLRTSREIGEERAKNQGVQDNRPRDPGKPLRSAGEVGNTSLFKNAPKDLPDNLPKDVPKKGIMSRALGSLKRNKGKAGLIGGGLAALGGGAYALSRNGQTAKAALLQEYLLHKEAERQHKIVDRRSSANALKLRSAYETALERALSNAPEDAVDKGMMSRALGSLKRNKGKAGLIGGGLAALGGGAYALSRNSETPKAALLKSTCCAKKLKRLLSKRLLLKRP